MSITFPLPTTFMDGLRLKDGFFNPMFQKEYSQGADGTLYDKDLGPELWRADFVTIDQPHADIKKIQADINSMREGTYTFYAYDPVMKYPQNDPDGSALGASTVTIHSLSSGKLSLDGLPAGYKITKADMLSFDYSTSPVCRAFHQASEHATADGSGVTPVFTVFPPIRDGAVTTTVVTLIKAACIMKVMPGTVKYTVANRMKTGIAFSAIQQISP